MVIFRLSLMVAGIIDTMNIAAPLISWQRQHGRHGLPWQQTRDPYRVWLSEIMLQQTQVSAVIPYYERFLASFPDVAALARAPSQDVMAHWAGLGYYARARNLHACAQAVMRDWSGAFPSDAAGLCTLPGIGPSTAAAIAAFCFAERAAILDGNVKRVLARHFAIDGDPTTRAVETRLWEVARAQVPTQSMLRREPDAMSSYTQGLMDLGATVCGRARPRCETCPLQKTCIAFKAGRTEELPWPRARKALPERSIGMLAAWHDDKLLLVHRPANGIWGGLWSLPEFEVSLGTAAGCRKAGIDPVEIQPLAAFLHTFTHYRLTIHPVLVQAKTLALPDTGAMQSEWVELKALAGRGLPAPVRKLIIGLQADALL